MISNVSKSFDFTLLKYTEFDMSKTLWALALLQILSLSALADQASDLRDAIDQTIALKAPIRDQRDDELQLLHQMRGDRTIKHATFGLREKEMLDAYRDYYPARINCASIVYQFYES